MVITAIIEASVAVNRLTEYLGSDELQSDAVMRKPTAEKRGEDSVRIRDGRFTWNRYDGSETLIDIDFRARKGELCSVVGRVGSGKSSMLEAMLGNLYKINGEVSIRGAVAYVSQSAWIMNASVKENIIFGHRWDPSFYEQTVQACALVDDFSSLPDGDRTEVGERGISLSGGQKARVTLARAVYARADVYLLDDVLSAVDSHVGRHIINNVLGSKGLLGSKSRVLATNSVPVLSQCDMIYMLNEGRVIENGTYENLMAKKSGAVAELVQATNGEEDSSSDDRSTSTNVEDEKFEPIADDEELENEEVEELQEGLTHLAPIRPPLNGVSSKESMMSLRRASTVSFVRPAGKTTDEEEPSMKTRQSEEGIEQGKVKWSVYGEYAKQSNLFAVGIYLGTLLAAQTAQVGTSI